VKVMAKILVVGSETEDTKRLLARLALHGYTITECADSVSGLSRFDKRVTDFDVVLFDISRDRPEDWEMLDTLSALRIGAPMQPSIICASRTYRGPRMRLEVERRGARLVTYG
jgi:CheY-like chemotaxis protein